MFDAEYPNYSARKLYAALIGVLVILSVLATHAAETSVYPGKLGIAKGRNLSPEERAVEARFAQYLEEHTDEAVARYTAKYGKEINTDNVRELSIDYAPGGPGADDRAAKAARTRWSAAVQEPASALSKEIYRRALREATNSDQRKQIIFTSGGAGVGKTTSIQRMPGLARATEAAEIVYDTTLSNLKSALDRVDQALAAGRLVSIIFVYRDPVESFVGGVLPRAERTGRILPLAAFLDTHLGALEVIAKIADAYKSNDRVAIAVIDNSRGRGNAALSDLEFVKTAAAKYRRDELKTRLFAELEIAYEKGKRGEKDGISEEIYRGIKGDAP